MECLPLRHIRGIANKRGFSVHVDDTIMHIVHKHGEMIQSSFDLSDPFKIDPACARQCTFMRAYYWMRGYGFERYRQCQRAHSSREQPPSIRSTLRVRAIG